MTVNVTKNGRNISVKISGSSATIKEILRMASCELEEHEAVYLEGKPILNLKQHVFHEDHLVVKKAP